MSAGASHALIQADPSTKAGGPHGESPPNETISFVAGSIREMPTEFWFVTQTLPAPTANQPGPVPAVTGMVAWTVPSAGSIRTMASPR